MNELRRHQWFSSELVGEAREKSDDTPVRQKGSKGELERERKGLIDKALRSVRLVSLPSEISLTFLELQIQGGQVICLLLTNRHISRIRPDNAAFHESDARGAHEAVKFAGNIWWDNRKVLCATHKNPTHSFMMATLLPWWRTSDGHLILTAT